jgi:hypothetical protein
MVQQKKFIAFQRLIILINFLCRPATTAAIAG